MYEDIKKELARLGLRRAKPVGKVERASSGPGKLIYFHCQYADIMLPDKDLYEAEEILLAEKGELYFQQWNTLRINPVTGDIGFQYSPDFDTADEPSLQWTYTVKGVEERTTWRAEKNPENAWIWHHKWAWVLDSYSGFDVRESMLRSLEWVSKWTKGKNKGGIGRKRTWKSLGL